jgi:hypothetical protein
VTGRRAQRGPACRDQLVRNVETGRFERSLSALTAAGALVTAAEIFFEHESASAIHHSTWTANPRPPRMSATRPG